MEEKNIIDYTLENWNQYSEESRFQNIKSEPHKPYYKIWETMSGLDKDVLMRTPDLNYKDYIDIINEKLSVVLFTFNEQLMTDLDLFWDKITTKHKSQICKHNKKFNYVKYWDKLSEMQKDIICFRERFDYIKYWDELTVNQRTSILQKREDFDYDKYWSDLTCEQSLYYLMLNGFNLEKDLDKAPKLIDGLLKSFTTVDNIFFHKFEDPLDAEKEYEKININNEDHMFVKYKIGNLEPNDRYLLIELLKKLNTKKYENILDLMVKNKNTYWKTIDYSFINTDELYIIRHDGKFLLPSLNIYISDYYLVYREKKLQNILDE